jgi:hypothetical protein
MWLHTIYGSIDNGSAGLIKESTRAAVANPLDAQPRSSAVFIDAQYPHVH